MDTQLAARARLKQDICIEVVDHSNFEMVLPLIEAYQNFYRIQAAPHANRLHFRKFLDCHEDGIQFVATHQNQAIGFATLYFPQSSLTPGRSCLLNDLYIKESYRGHRIGRCLIAHCSAYACAAGFHALHWQTEASNESAQRLYDRLGCEKSTWIQYSQQINPNPGVNHESSSIV